MGRRLVLLLPFLACALALGLLLAWLSSTSGEPRMVRASMDIAGLLRAGAQQGFERALEPRAFEFPREHAAHDGFQTEWWYFTGNLDAADGRRFGYQLTFFRSALSPAQPAREAHFAANHAWMAHFTVCDVAQNRFHSFERVAREGAGIAGCASPGPRVWLRDWSCEFSAAGASIRLRARVDELQIELELKSTKPPVLHGEQGLSRKNSAAGNASYYYSLTRLSTRGTLELNGVAHTVEGHSWMDREWMSSSLADEQVGWDWFALQLDDGSELMCYRLRRADSSRDPFDAGTFVHADGTSTALSAADLELSVERTWRSPRSAAEYPASWRIAVPSLELSLEVQPLIADQELDVDFRYWEGAVELRGKRGVLPVRGRGFVELVGYTDQRPGEFKR
jgi:predicted secreted hydrolase